MQAIHQQRLVIRSLRLSNEATKQPMSTDESLRTTANDNPASPLIDYET
jgi:hypothetical protein